MAALAAAFDAGSAGFETQGADWAVESSAVAMVLELAAAVSASSVITPSRVSRTWCPAPREVRSS